MYIQYIRMYVYIDINKISIKKRKVPIQPPWILGI